MASTPASVPCPCTFTIFGSTGDLSRRKILPALARLLATGALDPRSRVVAVTREGSLDPAAMLASLRAPLAEAGIGPAAMDELGRRLHVHPLGGDPAAGIAGLAVRLADLEQELDPAPRVFYLALPPSTFPEMLGALGEAGLGGGPAPVRVVVEKPFGRDLRSAMELNALAYRFFAEAQLFRIDHYLGKETVQNLLVFRFANAMFESLWNCDRVSAVQITVAETDGVGSRAGYYDRAGALRDMIQNHLAQLLTLKAMEVPARLDAPSIRAEKRKVLRSIAPLDPSRTVFGRYTAGAVGGSVFGITLHRVRAFPRSSTTSAAIYIAPEPGTTAASRAVGVTPDPGQVR